MGLILYYLFCVILRTLLIIYLQRPIVLSSTSEAFMIHTCGSEANNFIGYVC
jgi:hypothetical protein